MIKEQEIADRNSCLNRAKRGERIFVLLEHDPASAVAIRAWVAERIRLGKNKPTDRQIQSALDEALLMEAYPQPLMEHEQFTLTMLNEKQRRYQQSQE